MQKRKILVRPLKFFHPVNKDCHRLSQLLDFQFLNSTALFCEVEAALHSSFSVSF
jgi:hypothetical protein